MRRTFDLADIAGLSPDAFDPEDISPGEDLSGQFDYTMAQFRDGGKGFVRWVETYCHFPIYAPGSDIPEWYPANNLPSEPDPITGKSWAEAWSQQKKILHEALAMENGRFKHRLIVFIWPRGEGKSFITVLIQLWKFFCWPRQQIMLGANSKDQTKFVHYDIMRDIILNSPGLLAIVGERNIQEKEIRIKDGDGHSVCVIRSISSFSGIVSNITGYTFSEIFDMKNPKFFVQLDGSTRSIPNALGIIDSTVSERTHILYKLYELYRSGTDPSIFVSYRCSRTGDYRDYWNPNTTQAQLDSYRGKFPEIEFARYFLNTWAAGAANLFTAAMVQATQYIGVDGYVGQGPQLLAICDQIQKLKDDILADERERGVHSMVENMDGQIQYLQSRLRPIESVYQLRTRLGLPQPASLGDLETLGDLLNTDWAIIAGVDRADPMKAKGTGARTIVSVMAKGLPGSRGTQIALQEGFIPQYFYVQLHLAHIIGSSLEDIKLELQTCAIEYDGIDTLCSERWGMFDILPWCEDQGIACELISPSYTLQKMAFSEMYVLYRACRYKTPPVAIAGSKGADILVEEAEALDHDPVKKWYGSPEKDEKHGIQDDAMYANAWCVYGGRSLDFTSLRVRRGTQFFGMMLPNEALLGRY